MKKLKKGDKVIIIAGKDKGRTGTILKCIGKEKVIVEGVNMVKKHVKPNPNIQQTGGIIDKEAACHISNVSLVNPVTNKSDRVSFKYIKEGSDKAKKVRVFKSNGELVDVV